MLSDKTNRRLDKAQLNNNTIKEKGKHLNYEKRIKIEALSRLGLKSEEIGLQIGCSGRTVRRELNRGHVELLNSDYTTRIEYSADIAQQKHDYNATAKGADLKISKDYNLVEYIEQLIIEEKYSPYAAAQKIKENKDRFKTTISYKTIYNYIDKDIFPNLTNKHLPVRKENRKRNYNKIRTAANNSKGTSISERGEEIEKRDEYGHWEMDTVVGKKGTNTVLLVLTERKTRQEIIYKLKSKSQY